MVKRELKDCKSYNPPMHFEMAAIRLHGKEESGTQKFWMGISHFLPGGGAEYDYENSPTEKIYYVLEGEVVVYSKDKSEKFTLKKSDSIFIAPYEGRSVINETNLTATMLVVVNNPDV